MKSTGFVLLVILVLSIAPPVAAADAKLFEWAAGDTFEFEEVSGEGSIEVRAPIVRLTKGVLAIAIVGFTFENRQNPEWDKSVSYELVTKNAQWAEHIRFKIDATKITRPGKYAIALIAEGPSDATPPVSLKQQATAFIVRPEATVRAIGDLLVERVTWVPLTSRWVDDRISPLRLEETSRRSKVRGMVYPVGSAQLRGRQMGQVVFDPAALSLDPGAQVPLTLKVQGDVEPGVAKGTFEVDAPQLRTKLSVPYEIHNRLAKLWLGVAVVLGLVSGYFGRTGLAQKLTKLSKRRSVLEIETEIERELSAPDAPFKAALQKAQQDLSDETAKAIDADIDKAVQKAKTTLQDARADLAKRQQTVTQSLASLRQIVEGDWQVPDEIRVLLAEQRPGVEVARRALTAGDADGAQNSIDMVIGQLGSPAEGIGARARGARRVLEKLRPDLLSLANQLPAWIAGPLGTGVDRSAQALPSARAGDGVAGYLAELEKLSDAGDLMRQAADWAVYAMNEEALRAQEVATEIPNVSRELEAIAEAREAASSQTTLEIDKRDVKKLETLVRALAKLAEALLSGVSPENVPKIQALISAHSYAEAARAAVAARPSKAPLVAAFVGDEIPELDDGSPRVPVLTTALAVVPTAESVWQYSVPWFQRSRLSGARLLIPDAVAPVAVRRGVVDRATTGLVGLQRWVSGAVVLAMAYFVYSESFVGSAIELVGLFFYGFAADLTVESATALAAAKRR